jgi:hypothetical protein
MRPVSFSVRKLGFLIVALSLAGCSGGTSTTNVTPANLTPQASGATTSSTSRSVQPATKKPEKPEIAVSPATLSFASPTAAAQTITTTTQDGRKLTATTSDATCATVSAEATKPKRVKDKDKGGDDESDDAFNTTFTVTPVGTGSCTITITGKDGDKDKTATVAVTVLSPGPPIVAYCAVNGTIGNSPSPFSCPETGNNPAAGQVSLSEVGYSEPFSSLTGVFTSTGGDCPNFSMTFNPLNGWQANANGGGAVGYFTCSFIVSDTNGQSMTISFVPGL